MQQRAGLQQRWQGDIVRFLKPSDQVLGEKLNPQLHKESQVATASGQEAV